MAIIDSEDPVEQFAAQPAAHPFKGGSHMAWRNIGAFYLGPGASGRYWVSWRAPGDQGPQWLMAHADRGQPPTQLVVSQHTKELDYSIGWVRSDGASGYDYDSYYYRYLVTVTNQSSRGVTFSLEGGGV